MNKKLFPLLFLFCFFKIQITNGQNYYVPFNFAPINIVEKGDFTLSASENIFRKYRDQKYNISQSPFSNFYWNTGGVLTLNHTVVTRKERTSIIDFSIGSYYFFQTQKNKRYSKKRKKKRKRGKFTSMEKGILIIGGLGYSFGKNTIEFEAGSSSFSFQKFNTYFGSQLQLKHFGIGYYGGFGILDYKKIESKGKIENKIFSLINGFRNNHSFSLLNTTLRCYYGNQFGKLYFERIWFHTNTRLGQDYRNANFSLGISLKLNEFLNPKK